MKPKISLVIGVRNRKENILKQLKSLESCKKNFKNFEVTVVDYGGKDNLEEDLNKYNLNLNYLYIDTSEKWNESHAKNIGIRISSAEFIICTNADIIFEENSLKKIYKVISEKGKRLYHLNRWDQVANKDKETKRENAWGDFQGLYKEDWYNLRGYDETMAGWGGLDLDLKNRAFRRGLKEFKLDPYEIKIFHHFHKSNYNLKDNLNNFWRAKLNKFFRVNKNYWGKKNKIEKEQSLKKILGWLIVPLHQIYHNIKNS
jgi:glycosyltransferase involved in cell wall biosynthesis